MAKITRCKTINICSINNSYNYQLDYMDNRLNIDIHYNIYNKRIKKKMQWYVIHTFSGYEVKTKNSLQEKIKFNNLENEFGKILIPTENIIEIKSGKKKKSERKFFPGYILIEMNMTNETWFLVKNISNVFGFVGDKSGKPVPISEKEKKLILEKMKESSEKPKPKILFEPGEMVRVIDGPFSEFNGTVEEVNYDKNRLCIGVLIFGRSTPIDLDFSQVEKI